MRNAAVADPTRPARRSSRWKALERDAARALGGRRIVRASLFESSPDVLVEDFNWVVEAKAYRRFAHHSIIEHAQAKYCGPDQTLVLVTREPGKPAYATLPLTTLAYLVEKVRGGRAGRAGS